MAEARRGAQLALRIKRGKGAGERGQHSDGKAEVRCQQVCARVAGVPGRPPGKVHSYGAGGLCG